MTKKKQEKTPEEIQEEANAALVEASEVIEVEEADYYKLAYLQERRENLAAQIENLQRRLEAAERENNACAQTLAQKHGEGGKYQVITGIGPDRKVRRIETSKFEEIKARFEKKQAPAPQTNRKGRRKAASKKKKTAATKAA